MKMIILIILNFLLANFLMSHNYDKCELLAGSKEAPPVGIGTDFEEINIKKAIKVCEDALLNSPNSSNLKANLARAYSANNQIDIAIKLYEDAAKDNNVVALNNLASLIIEENKSKGLNYFIKAANLGFPRAAANAIAVYVNNQNASIEDKKKAIIIAENFLNKKNSALIKLRLAGIYFYDAGDKTDKLKNYTLVKKLLSDLKIDDFKKEGIPQPARYQTEVLILLGLIHMRGGDGVKKDLVKAYKYFQKCVDSDYRVEKVCGKYISDTFYFYAIDEKYFNKDLENIILSLGRPIDLHNIGVKYYNRGEKNNSLKWYKLGAEKGDNLSRVFMGKYFLNGKTFASKFKDPKDVSKENLKQAY